MSGSIKIKKIRKAEELKTAFHIRTEVFVKEQNVPVNIEMDEFDDSSEHYLCYLDEDPVATARIRITTDGYKLERFAVLKHARGMGIGMALVKATLKAVPSGKKIYLNSQLQVQGFYQKLGFLPIGDTFFEADIPHVEMVFNSETVKK